MFNYYYTFYKNPDEAAILGYLSIPVYKSKMIAYDNAYDEGEMFSYARNSYILNVPELNENEELKYLKDNLYYRCFNDLTDVFKNSYFIYSDKDDNRYSYLVAGKHSYQDVL